MAGGGFKAGAPGSLDPAILLKRYQEMNDMAPAADLQAPPPPIDPKMIQDTLNRATLVGLASKAANTYTPGWYGVQHGHMPTNLNPDATTLLEKQAQGPLEAAKMARQGQLEQQQFQNTAAMNKQQYAQGTLKNAEGVAQNEALAQGAQAQRGWQSHENELDRANRLKAVEKMGAIKLQRVPGTEAAAINKAEEVVSRARQTKALLHKYGNLGPLLQYGTVPAALGRFTGISTVKDASGRTVPPAELSNDANELNGHITYLTKEAPRALAAAGRMDAQSIKMMGNTFPGATDTEESGSKKLDQYIRHAHGLISKSDAVHNGAVRSLIYDGGELPGEQEAGALNHAQPAFNVDEFLK